MAIEMVRVVAKVVLATRTLEANELSSLDSSRRDVCRVSGSGNMSPLSGWNPFDCVHDPVTYVRLESCGWCGQPTEHNRGITPGLYVSHRYCKSLCDKDKKFAE